MKLPRMETTLEKRFWSKVVFSDDCWNWNRAISTGGYGRLMYHGKARHAHRVAWMICHGQIPDGKWVLHKCDNRRCVNPAHLYIGTRADNFRDVVERGRARNGSYKLYGDNASNRKLTEKAVLYIRANRPQKSLKELAEKFGVHFATISDAALGKRWRKLH